MCGWEFTAANFPACPRPPSRRLPATPPFNHFSRVSLIKGDLTERADHGNINHSPPAAAAAPNCRRHGRRRRKVNGIHYKKGQKRAAKVTLRASARLNSGSTSQTPPLHKPRLPPRRYLTSSPLPVHVRARVLIRFTGRMKEVLRR